PLDTEPHGAARTEYSHADSRHAGDAPGDDRVAQDLERQDRLARAPLDEGERDEHEHGEREREQDVTARPGVLPATTPDETEQKGPRPAREHERAEPVDRMLHAPRAARHRHRDDGEGDPADGQVDEEHPAPARVTEDEAAD